MSEELIDRIYEAAFVPDMWEKCLDALAALSASATGALMVLGEDAKLRGWCNPAIRRCFPTLLESGIPVDSPTGRRMFGARPTSFIRVSDVLTPTELANDPGRQLMESEGIGDAACSAIPLPTGDLAMFIFNRRLADGRHDQSSLDRLDGIRPHLARAGLMTARLRLEQARTTISTLERLGLPAAVLAGSGRVLATNALFERTGSLFVSRAFGGLAVADGAANKVFQQTLSSGPIGGEPLVRSIPLRRVAGGPPAVVHVLPLRRSAHDVFSGGDMLVAVTELKPSGNVPAPQILSALFDLSASEARLAAALAAGKPLRQAAAEIEIGVSSARTYLARIFAKTGTSQQSQLVALLKSAQPLATDSAQEGLGDDPGAV